VKNLPESVYAMVDSMYDQITGSGDIDLSAMPTTGGTQ
jgi:hypothetical protein